MLFFWFFFLYKKFLNSKRQALVHRVLSLNVSSFKQQRKIIQLMVINFCWIKTELNLMSMYFYRYDWNLLSTATPAINAWMNPCHRAIVSAQSLVRKLNNRISRVMACIMTEALDKQGIHVPAKVSTPTVWS